MYPAYKRVVLESGQCVCVASDGICEFGRYTAAELEERTIRGMIQYWGLCEIVECHFGERRSKVNGIYAEFEFGTGLRRIGFEL